MLNFELMGESLPDLLGGMVLTLELTLASLLLGMVLALPLAALRTARHWSLWAPAYGYITFFRGTPLLVQIFLLYYGTGQFPWMRDSILWPLLRESWWCAVLAFALNTAAYTAEILRGAIQAVPHGEIEAARALGMHGPAIFRTVILPQLWRFALPGIGNLWLVLLKDTALISVVGLEELMRKTAITAGATRQPFTFYFAAALIYLAFTLVSSAALQWAERRAGRGFRAV